MSGTETRDPAVEPTPAQWVDEFLALPRPEREARAPFILANWRAATRCWQQNHDDRLEDAAAARAEVARLREAVAALADEWADYEWPGPLGVEIQRVQAHTWEAATKEHARVLRAALAPDVSSGEAESGEPNCVDCGTPGDQCDVGTCCDGCYESGGGTHSPAPVSSGGQADGEGEDDDVYPTAADVIASEKAVNDRLRADLAARPVLSREALLERLFGHFPTFTGAGCACGWRGRSGVYGRHQWRDHLADVLAGEVSR